MPSTTTLTNYTTRPKVALVTGIKTAIETLLLQILKPSYICGFPTILSAIIFKKGIIDGLWPGMTPRYSMQNQSNPNIK